MGCGGGAIMGAGRSLFLAYKSWENYEKQKKINKKMWKITWSWLFFFLLHTANHAGHKRQMRMRIMMRMTRMPMGMVMARMVLVSIPVSEG